MKTCRICREEKPLSAYHKNAQTADGYMGKCADCNNRYQHALRNGTLDEFWEQVEVEGGLSPSRAWKLRKKAALPLWKVGRALLKEHENEKVDTMLCRAFTGGTLQTPADGMKWRL